MKVFLIKNGLRHQEIDKLFEQIQLIIIIKSTFHRKYEL